MGELIADNSISPFTAILWCFYPMAALVLIELILRAINPDDDDDDQRHDDDDDEEEEEEEEDDAVHDDDHDDNDDKDDDQINFI